MVDCNLNYTKEEIFSRIDKVFNRRGRNITTAAARTWHAAVLVALVEKDGEPAFIFEKRASTLSSQPGDICFPGGHYDKTDDDLRFAAVRETNEELGVPKKDIKVLGPLDILVTRTGPVVHPFIGTIANIEKIKPSIAEVESVLYIPLKYLLTYVPKKVNIKRKYKAPDDFPFDLVPSFPKGWQEDKGFNLYFYEYEGHVIWGITARILHAFIARYRRG
jgi:8-oxo-dGTP pyrophosphatase MutT (NUDIX family)